ncbi:MAG: type II toxin-antitoxin system RelE/ParE family toxin [Pseudomonadales bacterium]|nr:MAG: type II toxin-antitoxin system RelE/ParE family toxin [Pseudomonadales bacterium]
MAQIVWAEPALLDLEGIAEYIALDKPTAAKKYIQDVFSKVDRLKQFPNSGRKPIELPRGTRYREIVVGPSRIFYRLDGTRINILYVMRSERLLRNYILSERDEIST